MADHESTWRRSTYCADSACIEVRASADTVIVRTTADHDRELTLDRARWHEFLDGIKAGELAPAEPASRENG